MIEDIDYLYEHSKKENITLLVDSSKRNKTTHPNVAEFQVSFPQTFNYVYGIDILHTTIPRTQFMIESYNNALVSATHFDLLSPRWNGYQTVTFMPQDISSASSFVQRLNDQLNDVFNVDNYDNVLFDEKFTLRTVQDYPVLRFSTERAPFLINCRLSTMNNILGFNQRPNTYDTAKYNTINDILRTYTPVNKHRLEAIEPYESVVSTKVTKLPQSSTVVASYTINYVHTPVHQCGSFLQRLTIHANKKIVNFSSQPFVRVSVSKIAPDGTAHPLVEEFMYSFVSEESDHLQIDRFVHDPNADRLGGANTHLVLHHHERYQIRLFNVVALDDFAITHATIGFCYFYELQHVELNDDLFVSRTLYDESAPEITSVKHGSASATERTYCSPTKPLHFDLHTSDQMVSAFFSNTRAVLQEFRLQVEAYTDTHPLSPHDTYVLRIERDVPHESGSGETVREHVCEIQLKLEYDETTEHHHLAFDLENVQSSSLAYVHMSMGDSFDMLFGYSCTLFVSRPLYAVGSDATLRYTYACTYFESFGVSSPGILNLAYENYLVMRCPEIETHIRGSYSVNTDNEAGMGVLNIDVTGYATTRTEFFSVIYKEFHPIGKLDKLSFRFERKSDQKLYDFKNVDLHFLMSIKFLRPFNPNKFEQSVLNPNYDGNYLGYLPKNMTSYDEQDDNTDEEFLEENHEYLPPSMAKHISNDRFVRMENRLNKQLREHRMLDD